MKFRLIPSLPKYKVSETGVVKRLDGYKPKLQMSRGYCRVCLNRGDKQVMRQVHRLVAEAWVRPGSKKQTTVNHIDGVKTNNHWSNLEYASPREQIHHAIRTGLRTQFRKEVIFTKQQVLAIREWVLTKNNTLQSAVDKFGSNCTTISGIVQGKRWKDVGGPLRGSASLTNRQRQFTNTQIKNIRIRVSRGGYQAAEARRYKVDQTTIASIVQGVTYKDAEGPLKAPKRRKK